MTIYIFAYGSLINIKYIKELNKSTDRIIKPIIINNLQRHWILCKNNKIYLGIRYKKSYKTNGIIFNVSEDELQRLDNRETYYTRIKINKDLLDFKYINIILKEDDIIYAYFPNPKVSTLSLYDKYNEHCKKYLIKCLSGCLKFGRMFFVDFLKMTYGWNNF